MGLLYIIIVTTLSIWTSKGIVTQVLSIVTGTLLYNVTLSAEFGVAEVQMFLQRMTFSPSFLPLLIPTSDEHIFIFFSHRMKFSWNLLMVSYTVIGCLWHDWLAICSGVSAGLEEMFWEQNSLLMCMNLQCPGVLFAVNRQHFWSKPDWHTKHQPSLLI